MARLVPLLSNLEYEQGGRLPYAAAERRGCAKQIGRPSLGVGLTPRREGDSCRRHGRVEVVGGRLAGVADHLRGTGRVDGGGRGPPRLVSAIDEEGICLPE